MTYRGPRPACKKGIKNKLLFLGKGLFGLPCGLYRHGDGQHSLGQHRQRYNRGQRHSLHLGGGQSAPENGPKLPAIEAPRPWGTPWSADHGGELRKRQGCSAGPCPAPGRYPLPHPPSPLPSEQPHVRGPDQSHVLEAPDLSLGPRSRVAEVTSHTWGKWPDSAPMHLSLTESLSGKPPEHQARVLRHRAGEPPSRASGASL